MDDGRFRVEIVGGIPVVEAPEEIDIINAPDLRSALLAAAAGGHGTLVADMTRTRFCDSSGLQTLLAAHKRAQAEGGELLLVISSTAVAVLRVFALTGIDQMIPNFSSLDQALAHTSPGRSNDHPRADDGLQGNGASVMSGPNKRAIGHRRADPVRASAGRPDDLRSSSDPLRWSEGRVHCSS